MRPLLACLLKYLYLIQVRDFSRRTAFQNRFPAKMSRVTVSVRLFVAVAAMAAWAAAERGEEALGGRALGAFAGDLLCMCRTFETPRTGWAGQDKEGDEACAASGWASRWRRVGADGLRGGVEVMADGVVAVSSVRALVFDSHAAPGAEPARVVVFRHQEGETLLDADMWEAMALYGRDFTALQWGERPGRGGAAWRAVDALAWAAQAAIFYVRRALGLSYLPHALRVAEAATPADGGGRRLLLGGYSLGGALAQLAALRLGVPAVALAGNGVRDAAALYGLSLPPAAAAAAPLINVVDATDMVPRMDCALGRVCVVPNERAECVALARSAGAGWEATPGVLEDAACPSHRNFVYGPWLQRAMLAGAGEHLASLCVTPDEWNKANGVCA